LKNIMGLWLVQQCRKSFENRGASIDYGELVRKAGEAPALRSLIDPDSPRFLNPPDMPTAIKDQCRETGEPVPETEGQMVRCALESLALKYATVLGWLEQATGDPIEVIHVVGGGSRNALLNQFTADACQRPVLAGPVEATVLGNLMVQAQACGAVGSLHEQRAVITNSCELQHFEPISASAATLVAARERFARLLIA
jgi:rhamnulokinase